MCYPASPLFTTTDRQTDRQKFTVFLLACQELTLATFAAFLQRVETLTLLGQATTPEQAQSAINVQAPTLLLIDVDRADGPDLTIVSQLRQLYPTLHFPCLDLSLYSSLLDQGFIPQLFAWFRNCCASICLKIRWYAMSRKNSLVRTYQKTVASTSFLILLAAIITACTQPMDFFSSLELPSLFQPESPLLPEEVLELTKHPWRVVTIIHQNEPVAFDAIQPIYVDILPDGLSAQTTNCNRLGFGFNSTRNQQYQLGEGVMTEMLCPERQTKQFDDFYAALSTTNHFTQQGDELRLMGEASEIVLEATYPFNLAHPVFTQNRWQLLEITDQGHPVIFDAIRPVYLEITGDGDLHFKTEQCNFATFTIAIKSDEYYQLGGGDTSYECPQITDSQFSALSSAVFQAVLRTNTLKLNGIQLLLTGDNTRVVLEVDNAL